VGGLACGHRSLYGGKTVAGAIAFGFPQREVDLDAANDYVIHLMQHEPCVTASCSPIPPDTGRAIAAYERSVAAGVPFSRGEALLRSAGPNRLPGHHAEYIPDGLLEFMDDRGC